MVYISSKLEVFDFSGGQNPPIRGLTITERSWNYWNLPYLVANTYGLNFIKIRAIWIFRGWVGRNLLLGGGGYTWCAMPIFELGWAVPVKIHVWKFGLEWLKSDVCEFSGGLGVEAPYYGVTCDLRYPSLNLAELFQSKVMCENLVQIGWAFQEL